MRTGRQNEHDLNKLLNQALKDDLPSETEFRMRRRLTVFRRALEASDHSQAARSAGWWRRPPMFEGARHRVLAKEVLAYVSAIMLTAGAVIHLAGYQSLLADSVSLLKTSISLAEQVRLAGSMDCVIRMPAGSAHATAYHLRWVRDGGTRLDVESSRGVDETLWINHGRVTIANSAAAPTGPAAIPAPGLPEEVMALLSPADLARRLDESWQLQPEEKQHNPDRLLFIDRKDRAVIEVHFDRESFFPISLSRKPAEANGQRGTGGVAATAEFIWNRPVTPDLMVPGIKTGR